MEPKITLWKKFRVFAKHNGRIIIGGTLILIVFIMGICAYVCAPWTVRALVYRRWKWLPVAFLLMWVSIDGVYSLYWWCRGFDALQIFRGANAIYCLPLYFVLGFVMNFEMRRSSTQISIAEESK